jgi:hypothetical protein
VNQSDLGTITTWNIDATARTVGDPYTYLDFGWEVPGNPGSSPTDPAPGSPYGQDLGLLLIGVLAAVAVLGVLLWAFVRRRKREDVRPADGPKQ